MRFHDVLVVTDGIHNECLYSQAANITIKNSHFSNCATMDVFFTRGTWWGQPAYGGWTLTNNFFGAPRFLNGQCCHYYAVYWAYQSVFDRAVVRGNTFESQVTADGDVHQQRRVLQHAGVQPAGHGQGDVRLDAGADSDADADRVTVADADRHAVARRRTVGHAGAVGAAGHGLGRHDAELDQRLRWDASTDNRGVAGYRLYRNGTAVGTHERHGLHGHRARLRHELHDRPDRVRRGGQRVAARRGHRHHDDRGLLRPRRAVADADGHPVADLRRRPTPTPTATPSPAPTPPVAPARRPASSARGASTRPSGARQGLEQARATTARSRAPSASRTGSSAARCPSTASTTTCVADAASLDLHNRPDDRGLGQAHERHRRAAVVFKENRTAGHQAYSLYAANGSAKPAAEFAGGTKYTTLQSSRDDRRQPLDAHRGDLRRHADADLPQRRRDR